MDILEQLLTLSNLVFCLFIAILVWLERKGVETLWKNSKTNKYWNELALPVSPLLFGGVLGFLVKQYPFPDQFTSGSSRFFFGVVLGLLSGHAYKIVKGLIQKKEQEAGDPGPDDGKL